MERVRRVSSFWNWLPAFRAVAEAEHLPTAAGDLCVSAPALSRSIRLLEKDLGKKLFRRSGRRIELNEAGSEFLAALRDGMRLIHEGMLAVQEEQLTGAVRVAGAGVVTTAFVVPALLHLRRQHAELVPEVLSTEPAQIVPQLLRGELDVAFRTTRVQHARLRTIKLGAVTTGVYCGAGHPLVRRRKLTLEEIGQHEFVAPPADAAGLPVDGWPADAHRRCALLVDQMRIGCEVCSEGELLAVLPDAVAAAHGEGLHRLPLDVIPAAPVFAVHRPSLGMGSRAEAIVDEVARRLRGSPYRVRDRKAASR